MICEVDNIYAYDSVCSEIERFKSLNRKEYEMLRLAIAVLEQNTILSSSSFSIKFPKSIQEKLIKEKFLNAKPTRRGKKSKPINIEELISKLKDDSFSVDCKIFERFKINGIGNFELVRMKFDDNRAFTLLCSETVPPIVVLVELKSRSSKTYSTDEMRQIKMKSESALFDIENQYLYLNKQNYDLTGIEVRRYGDK